MFWFCVWSSFVFGVVGDVGGGGEFAFCVAELEPVLTLPPAIETGTFALTAVWSLFAAPMATCCVWAFWIPAWNPPAPPQPA